MTKLALIAFLTNPANHIPDHAEILAFDGDACDVRPVTGILHGLDPGDTTKHFVELCTDAQDDSHLPSPDDDYNERRDWPPTTKP